MHKKLKLLLLALNFFVALLIFVLSIDSFFPDQNDYIALAKGILNGRFSSYFYLDHYYPATLRSPGYPIFLAIFLSLSENILIIKFAQLFIYFFSIYLCLSILKHLVRGDLPQYIFLVLSTICIQIPFYSALISTELVTIFLIVLILYFLLTKEPDNMFSNLVTGILLAILVMVKPAFVLLPFMLLVIVLFFNRVQFRKYLLIFIFFLLGCVPFSALNFHHHGVFKPTTIEGMATIAHMGYWNFKLPTGYRSKFDSYHTIIVADLFNPFKYSDNEIINNIQEFEEQWRVINIQLEPYLPESFADDLSIMQEEGSIFPTYPSDYVIQREKLLTASIIQNVKNDPSYFIKTRIYNFFRVFFTGINPANLSSEASAFSKVQMLLAFAISFSIIFCGFLFISFFILRNWQNISHEILIIYSFILYTAGVHIPFSVQARYSVPIHLCLLILLSIITSNRHSFIKKKNYAKSK